MSLSGTPFFVKKEGYIMLLLEKLEEHDDVQNVYANFDIPDEILQKLDI